MVATTAGASVWLLLAAALVVGALQVVDVVGPGAPVRLAAPSWSPLGALAGLGRVALLAALGAAATAIVLALRRRLARRPTHRPTAGVVSARAHRGTTTRRAGRASLDAAVARTGTATDERNGP